MALIAAGYLRSKFIVAGEEKSEATKAAIGVPKVNLSEAYDLPDGAIVIGELLKIEGYPLPEEDKAILKEIEGEKVEFILDRLRFGSVDDLLLSKKSWPLFRDYSILPDMGYRIIMKLTEAKVNSKTIPIFPKRDVFIGL